MRCSRLLAHRHILQQKQTSHGSGGQRARRLAGSRCQSWNGFNGGAGCTYISYTRSAAQSLLAFGSAQGGIMLHAAAGYLDRRGGCKGRKSEQQASKPSRCCAASLYFEPAAEGRQCRNRILRLLCRLALSSPKNIQMALLRGHGVTDGALRYEAQDGEEGRAEAVMRNVSKQCVSACRTAEAVMP